MNEIATTVEFDYHAQFDAWREALVTGKPVAYERGVPTAGYYRLRDRNADRSIRWDAVGIWQDGVNWFCFRTGPRAAPTHLDEMEALFVNCNSTPISYELFEAIRGGGAWPEDIAPAEVASPALEPHEAVAAELKAQREAAAKWLAELGRNPAIQEEADKAANYADAFAKLEKRADKLRTDEKEPHLSAGRDVDAKWKPVIEAAAAAKKKAKGLSEDFAAAEKKRREAEAAAENARRQREFEIAKATEQARLENEERLRAKGVMVPEFAPPPKVEPPKPVVAEAVRVGTSGKRQSLHKIPTYEITDATALLTFLAMRNLKSADLLAAALADAKALVKVGIEVPGFLVGEKEEIR